MNEPCLPSQCLTIFERPRRRGIMPARACTPIFGDRASSIPVYFDNNSLPTDEASLQGCSYRTNQYLRMCSGIAWVPEQPLSQNVVDRASNKERIPHLSVAFLLPRTSVLINGQDSDCREMNLQHRWLAPNQVSYGHT
jgi:hypothetical protein